MALDKEDIKQLISILQRGLDDSGDKDSDSEETPKNNIKTKKSKAKKNSSKNKFLEFGFDKLHKEDIAIDKILNQKPRTPRRKTLKQVDVRCRVCGKQEKINPSLLYESPDRYKCNKCCSSPG